MLIQYSCGRRRDMGTGTAQTIELQSLNSAAFRLDVCLALTAVLSSAIGIVRILACGKEGPSAA